MRLLAILCLLLLQPGPAQADPALFVARAPGITAYLFGSVHVLRPGTDWERPALTRAYREASECWFEIRITNAPKAGSAWSRAIDPSSRLPALLSGAEHARLRQRIVDLDLPGGPAVVDRLRPWMVYLLIATGDVRKLDTAAGDGVDKVLEARATRDGKRVVPLETIEDQIDVFASQPDGNMLRLVHAVLAAPAPALGSALDELVRHWLDGDVDWLGQYADEFGRRIGPSFFQALLRNRNRAWGDKLAALKAAPNAGRGRARTILVTVGAAHLAGPDNLIEQLRSRGFTVERITQ